jgi:undecaprenyl-diphosphatase
MEQLIALDQQLLYGINRLGANPLLDALMPMARNMYFWAPLYAFLIAFFALNFGRKGWIVVGFVLLTFACTDLLSSSVVKPLVGRLRPCNDEEVRQWVRLLVQCGGGKSFTSSHAANHFGVGIFLGLVLKPFFKPALGLFIGWAGTISLAQVYVGVHYPVDILGGALLGTTIGWIMWRIYLSKWRL